jgi:chromosome segregation ATPase
MITLDQIRRLQDKVETAVKRITELKNENNTLKNELDRHLHRIKELEDLINEFKDAQTEIEAGILSALDQLDRIENDSVERENPLSTGDVDQEADQEDRSSEDSRQSEIDEKEDLPETVPVESGHTEESDPSAEGPDDDSSDTEQDESGELDIF